MSIKLISLTGRECTAETEADAAPFIELGYKRVTDDEAIEALARALKSAEAIETSFDHTMEYHRDIAEWVLASDAIRAMKAEAWNEGLGKAFHDASFTLDGLLEQNPYRAH